MACIGLSCEWGGIAEQAVVQQLTYSSFMTTFLTSLAHSLSRQRWLRMESIVEMFAQETPSSSQVRVRSACLAVLYAENLGAQCTFQSSIQTVKR